jgi:hypothetical protein
VGGVSAGRGALIAEEAMIRVVWLADLHCGSGWGLAPPDRWVAPFAEAQKQLWQFYELVIEHLGDADVLIVAGDAIDGPGRKDSTAHITTDVIEQADIAAEVIRHYPAKQVRMVQGTPYHVSANGETERIVAREVGATISEEDRIEVEGFRVHTRHTGGRSDTPYGQGTQLHKELVRDLIQGETYGYDRADIVVRAHVHYYLSVDTAAGTAVSLPCWEWPRGSYGRKLRTQYYDIGAVAIEFDDGTHEVRKHLARLHWERGYETIG